MRTVERRLAAGLCLMVVLAPMWSASSANAVAVPVSRECSACLSAAAFFPNITSGKVRLGRATFDVTPESRGNVCCVKGGELGVVYPNVMGARALRILVNAHDLSDRAARRLGQVRAIFDDGSDEVTDLVLGSTVRELAVDGADPQRYAIGGLRSGTTQLYPVLLSPGYRLDMVSIGLSPSASTKKLVAVVLEGDATALRGQEKLLVFGVDVLAPKSLVAFQSGAKVFIADDEGEEVSFVADLPNCELSAMSPDGGALALSCGSAARRSVVLFDVNDHERRVVYEGRTGKVRFSPDGARLVFFDFEHNEVRAVDVVGGQASTLLRVRSKADVEPALSPDGATLVFTLRGDLYVARQNGRKRVIARRRQFKAQNQSPVLQAPLFDQAGGTVIFERRLRAGGAYSDSAVDRVVVADSSVRNLVASSARTPDRNRLGTSIGIRRSDGVTPTSHLAVVNADGSRPRRIADDVTALALGPSIAGTCNNCRLDPGEECETGLGDEDPCDPLGSCAAGCDVESCTCAAPPTVITPPRPTPTLLPPVAPNPEPSVATPQPIPVTPSCSSPGAPWVCRRVACQDAHVFTGYSPARHDLQNPVGLVYRGEVYPTHALSGDNYAARIIYRGQYLNILRYCIAW